MSLFCRCRDRQTDFCHISYCLLFSSHFLLIRWDLQIYKLNTQIRLKRPQTSPAPYTSCIEMIILSLRVSKAAVTRTFYDHLIEQQLISMLSWTKFLACSLVSLLVLWQLPRSGIHVQYNRFKFVEVILSAAADRLTEICNTTSRSLYTVWAWLGLGEPQNNVF